MAFLERNANRGSISTDYDIPYSLKLEPDNSESLTYTGTQSTGGNAKTWTWAGWIKRTELDGHSYLFSAGYTGFIFMSTENWLRFAMYDGSTSYYLDLDMVFRDTSAWYHIVGQLDTTQATAADRCKIWVNGVRQTEFRASTNYTTIPQNTEMQIGQTGSSSNWLKVGDWYAAGRYLAGYIADWHFTDGVANEADAFGRFDSNGVWVPKKYTGSYGTIGYYLDFSDSANLGDDANGSYSFSEGNITAADQATDTPTNNFCTMNQNARTNGNIRTQEGGTYVTTDGGSGWCSMLGTMAMSAGKWYWEALVNDNGDALTVYVGIAPHNDPYVPHHQTGYYLGNVETAGSMGWYLSDGSNKNQNGSWGNPARGDKIMFAYDADNIKMYYGINGTWGNSANPANGTGSVTSIDSYWMSAVHNALDFVLPAVTVYQGKHMKGFNFGGYCAWTIASGNADANGYGNFEYAPPSGFYALCSKNLAEFGG